MDHAALREGLGQAVPYNDHLGLDLAGLADGRVEAPVEVRLQAGDGTRVAEVTVHWHVRRT